MHTEIAAARFAPSTPSTSLAGLGQSLARLFGRARRQPVINLGRELARLDALQRRRDALMVERALHENFDRR